MGAKAIKLGSWDKHPAYCQDLNVDVLHMGNGINVMGYFKPGKLIRNDVLFKVTQTYSEKGNPSAPIRSGT